MGDIRNFLKTLPLTGVRKSCFMSLDEIARIFSKSQNSYMGETVGIFSSVKAYIVGERSVFFQVPGPWEKHGIFLSFFKEI